MNFNWMRNIFFGLALCVAGVATPSFAAGEQAVIAQAPTTYTITVDHNLSLEQMVTAGDYDWVDKHITSEYFPPQGKGKEQLIVEIVTIDRVMSSEGVLAEIAHRGLRPATLVEQLAFSAAYPEEQRKYPIVALGSVARVDDEWSVPNLNEFRSRRSLGLDWWRGGWRGFERFLAVRK